MALNNTQQRNLERIVGEDFNRLDHELYQWYQKAAKEARNKAEADWLAANPGFEKVLEDAQKYAKAAQKRIHKKMVEFVEEANKTLGTNLKPAASYASVYTINPPQDEINDLQRKAEGEVFRTYDKARDAIFKARQERIREILLATVTDNVDDLLKVPTIDEILAGL